MPTHKLLLTVTAAAGLLAGCAGSPGVRGGSRTAAVNRAAAGAGAGAASTEVATATRQVAAAERALAKAMADRNLDAFLALLSPDAIFFNGSSVEHGPAEIAEVWAPYFAGPRAPFSWAPDHVEVLADGKLALSTGPMMQQGQVVGRFNSVWRLEAPNTWHIVFDKGEAVCSAPARPGGQG
jgi:ketosteroid isomerase-like protein